MSPQPVAHARDLRKLLPGSNRRHQELQEAVLRWLELHRIPAVPVHTGPRVTPLGDGAFRLYGNPAQRGLADVLAVLPPFGRTVLLEVKTGRAHRSQEQVRMHERLGAAGALSIVVRSLDDLEILKADQDPDRGVDALAAAWLFGKEYSAQSLSVVEWYAKLPDHRKQLVREFLVGLFGRKP